MLNKTLTEVFQKKVHKTFGVIKNISYLCTVIKQQQNKSFIIMNIERIILISLDACTSLNLTHNNHILPLMKVNGKWSVMYGNPFAVEGEFFLEIQRLKGRKIEFQGQLYTPDKFINILYDEIITFKDLKQTLYFGIDNQIYTVKTPTEFESIMRYIQNNKIEFSISVGEPLPNGVSENQLELGFPQPQIESEFDFEYENENTRWVFFRENGKTTVKQYSEHFVQKGNFKGCLNVELNSAEFPMLDKLCLLDLMSYLFRLNRPKIMEDSWTDFNSSKNCKERVQSKIEKIIEKNNHKSLVVSK